MVAAHVGSVACMLCIALASPPGQSGESRLSDPLRNVFAGAFAMSQILAGPGASGRWVGIQNAVGNLAGVIAPALTGLLVEETITSQRHSWSPRWSVFWAWQVGYGWFPARPLPGPHSQLLPTRGSSPCASVRSTRR